MTNTSEHFPYAIIGGGKGGKTLAIDLASSGQSVVMVERGMIGGSCINVACIPTKTMVRSAKVADLARHAAEYGVRVDYHGIDLAGVQARRRSVVGGMVRLNQEKFDQSGMRLLIGTARFTGPRTFEVRSETGVHTIQADKVFINTGTRPVLPAYPGLAAVHPLTSESIQQLQRLPDHLIILGAGYIGLEFAQMFRRFGSRVTVLERGPRFLPREDVDVGEQVLKVFQEDGIEVVLSAEVRELQGKSGDSVRVVFRTPGGERTVEGSDLLVAAGRAPNTEDLNLPATGVEVDARGYVRVNERLETTAADIWAIADVNGGPQFTHVSLDDYRILKANLLDGGDRSTRGRLVPYTLFIDPELGRVGLTEEEARQRGLDIRVARLPVAAIPRARTLGEMRGYLKAIVDAGSGRILGASILAPEGGEIMAVIQVAMMSGLAYQALQQCIFAHPTMAEALNDLFARVER